MSARAIPAGWDARALIARGRGAKLNEVCTAWTEGPRVRMQCECGETALSRQCGVPWRCRHLDAVKLAVFAHSFPGVSRVFFQGGHFERRTHWTELAYVHYCKARHYKRYEANAAAVIQLAASVAAPALLLAGDEVALDLCLEKGSLSEQDAAVLALTLRGYRPTGEVLALLLSGVLHIEQFETQNPPMQQCSLAIGD